MWRRISTLLALAALLAGCSARPPAPGREEGIASWYGLLHHGRTTASGRPFDMYRLTAAHPALPLGARVRVTNVENGRSVVVLVTDRGPAVPGRIIDLSLAAARALGMVEQGLARVRVDVLAATE